MSTRTEYELSTDRTHDVIDFQRVGNAYNYAMRCAEGDSNDSEIQALQELVDELLDFAGIKVHDVEVEECDKCGEEVQYLSTREWCDGCEEEDAQADERTSA